MSVIVLENDVLKIGVSSLGAELVSLYDKADKRELLWQGNRDIWPGQAPVLFPLIGRLKNEEYEYGGKRYKMKIHGFAKEMEFGAEIKTDDSITFVLRGNAETKKLYPFDFEFKVRYTLNGKRVLKEHITVNTSQGVMYYEVGGHEGYMLPLAGNEKMNDYFLLFKGKKSLKSLTNNNETKMLYEEKKEIPLEDGRLFLNMDIFAKDALILEDEAGKEIEIHGPRGCVLKVRFDDFKYVGVWTMYKPFDTNYICIEPWSSLPDFEKLGFELTKKAGIRMLSAGQSETLRFSITVN